MANESVAVEDVVADIQHQIKRCVGAKAVETKGELVNNVYPMMLSMIESIMGRLGETEEVVASLLGETDSIVQPELYTEIANAFNAGRALAAAVTDPALAELVQTFLVAADAAEAQLAEVALDEDADEEDDDEEGPEAS